jgi:hypothetical protein
MFSMIHNSRRHRYRLPLQATKRLSNRQPAIVPDIEHNEKISQEQRRPTRFELARGGEPSLSAPADAF